MQTRKHGQICALHLTTPHFGWRRRSRQPFLALENDAIGRFVMHGGQGCQIWGVLFTLIKVRSCETCRLAFKRLLMSQRYCFLHCLQTSDVSLANVLVRSKFLLIFFQFFRSFSQRVLSETLLMNSFSIIFAGDTKMIEIEIWNHCGVH